jgi:hypothetical protein
VRQLHTANEVTWKEYTTLQTLQIRSVRETAQEEVAPEFLLDMEDKPFSIFG